VRKERRLTLQELAPWCWELPKSGPGAPRPDRIDWTFFFGNSHPVEIEVGMGKGLFLLTQALARPDVNFLGIEVVRKYQLYVATRVAIRKLPNVKTACADAKRVLHDFVPPASVSAIHVLFPDPWWKLKHRKRRVFTPDFAMDAARAIMPGGKLHIASDVEEYFGVMTDIVKAIPAFKLLDTNESREPVAVAGFETNFERKAREQGTPVWRAVFERTGEESSWDRGRPGRA
jgi:tRNA (guanine-N7-)-methyltransferase